MASPLQATRRERGAGTRRHPVLAGMLVLTLVSMLAATAALGARPTGVNAQDAALETASVTPADALLYVSVNLDTESDQFTQSQQLADRAGLLDLFETAAAESGDEDLASVQEDLGPFLGGDAALVITSLAALAELDTTGVAGGLDVLGEGTPEATDGGRAQGTGVAAVVRAGDPDAAYAKAQELLEERADEVGVSVDSTEYEGTTIESVAADEASGSEGTAIGRVGDFVVVGGAPADIEPIVDTQAGTNPSLSERAEFDQVRGELNDAFLLFAFIDGPAIKETVGSLSAGTANALAAQNLAALDAYTGAVIWADDPGFRLDTISVPTENAAEVPGSQNFDGQLDERMPGDSLIFVNGIDLGAQPALEAIGLLIAQQINGGEPGAAPPEGVTAEEYADEQFEQASETLGFDLRSDFIDQMVGEYAFAVRVANLNLLDPTAIGAIFVSGVEDPSTLADAVSKISFIIAASVGETTTYSTREVDGSTVNVVEDTSAGLPLRAEYGVVGDQFIVGLGNSLEEFVDGPTDSLADNPQYQAVLDTLPAEHGATFYVDLAQVVTLVQSLTAATGGGDAEVVDASEECANYDSQEEAQAAYDEDPSGLIDLDQDFDGEACEDHFNPSTPQAATSPADVDLSALRAFAGVQYQRDGLRGSSSILYIASE